jgi:hypothetical protein
MINRFLLLAAVLSSALEGHTVYVDEDKVSSLRLKTQSFEFLNRIQTAETPVAALLTMSNCAYCVVVQK